MVLERSVVPLAGFAAVLAVVAALAERRAAPPRSPLSAAASASAAVDVAACPPGSLPDQGVCVPVPREAPEARAASEAPGGPDIRLRPGQPEALSDYELPLRELARAGSSAPPAALPDATKLPGLWLPAALGSEVRTPRLAGQQGESHVLWAVDLVGPTVVTEHRVLEGGRERRYVVISGNLKTLAPLSQGQRTPAALGRVGDTLTPGTPSLYLDVRRPREGVDMLASSPESLLQPTQTISVDPRNVLERRKR